MHLFAHPKYLGTCALFWCASVQVPALVGSVDSLQHQFGDEKKEPKESHLGTVGIVHHDPASEASLHACIGDHLHLTAALQ